MNFFSTADFITAFPPSIIIINLIGWAKDTLERLPHYVDNACFCVRWTDDGILQSLFYYKGGNLCVCEELHAISLEELKVYKDKPLAEHGILSDKEYKVLTSGENIEIAKLHRYNNEIKIKSDILFDPLCVVLSPE